MKNKNYDKLYRNIQLAAIIGVFVCVALIVFATTGFYKMTTVLFAITCIIAVICMSLILILPWTRRLGLGNKTLSIVMLSFTALTCVLWIAAVIVIVRMYVILRDGISTNSIYIMLNYVKIVMIITLQFFMINAILSTVFRLKKTLIPFQVVSGVSNIVVDFFFTMLFVGLQIKSDKVGFSSLIADIIFNRYMITILILALLYVMISRAILSRLTKKKFTEQVEAQEQKEGKNEDIQQKLEKLKNLYDKNLITEEEYQKQKAKILGDM